MSNFVYPKFVRDLLLGTIGDVTSLTWKLAAISTSSFDKTDEFLVDIGAVTLGTPVALPSVSLAIADDFTINVSCDDSPPLLLSGVTSLDTVRALVVYIDSGSSATSNLVCWIDHRGDTSPVRFTGTGDDVPITFPNGYFFKL